MRVEEEHKENPHRELAKTINFSDLNNIENDKISHWLLRLAYAKNKDVFVNLEGHFFKIRLEKTLNDCKGAEDRKKVLIDILKKYYQAVDFNLVEQFDKTGRNFISIPFEDAVSLMAMHKVVIRDGLANIEEKFYSNLIRLLYMRNLKVAYDDPRKKWYQSATQFMRRYMLTIG